MSDEAPAKRPRHDGDPPCAPNGVNHDKPPSHLPPSNVSAAAPAVAGVSAAEATSSPAPAEARPRPAAGIPGLARERPRVHRLVLTGGPCAGKTTLLATLQTSLEERTGVKVFCVPEAATLLVTGGLQWSDLNDEKIIEYQLALLRVQMALEDNFYNIAKAYNGPALIVCDRGAMDGRAYSTQEQFDEITRRSGFTQETLRNERYDAVLHLASASMGAETHYNMDNPARFESIVEAQKADERLRHMYIGHPRVKIIDNSAPSFSDKLDRAVGFVYEVIGHAKPKRMRRFLVRDPPAQAAIPVPSVAVTLCITVLGGSVLSSIRLLLRRVQGTSTLFAYHQIDRDGEGAAGERTEMHHNITAREYAHLIIQRDPNHVDVVKTGLSFTMNSHFFELSVFTSPQWCVGIAMLYTDCSDLHSLPPWLNVGDDTSNNPAYSSFCLSKSRDSLSEQAPSVAEA